MPSGEFKTRYAEELAFVKWKSHKILLPIGILAAALLPLPLGVYGFYLGIYTLTTFIAVMGLNMLVGVAGQIAFSQGAFMAISSYLAAYIAAETGMPYLLIVPFTAIVAAGVGMLFGLPSLRVKGYYLAITTLGLQFLMEFLLNTPKLAWFHGGSRGLTVPQVTIAGYTISRAGYDYYLIVLAVAVIVAFGLSNICRSQIGRAFKAIRDDDVAAEILGINVLKYKLLAFATATFVISLGGGLLGYNIASLVPTYFAFGTTVDHYVALILGGLGRIVWGSLLGALVWIAVVEVTTGYIMPAVGLSWGVWVINTLHGVIIIGILLTEPKGLIEIARKIKEYFRLWPFRYEIRI